MMDWMEWLHAVPFAALPVAYAVELIQFACSCIGTPLSLRGTWESWVDRKLIIEGGPNGPILYAARRNFREEVLRLLMHLAFLYNGWILITYAPPAPDLMVTDDRIFQLIVTRLTCAFVIIVLSLKSWSDLKDRRYLRHLADIDPAAAR